MITRYDRDDITFDEVDDLLNYTPQAGGGGKPTATATATPKATATPSPRDRVTQLKDPATGKSKWYVIDLATGQPISPPYDTVETAKYHATYTYPLTTPTPTPGAFSTSTPTPVSPPTGVSNPGMYPQELLAQLDVNMNYTGPPGYGGATAGASGGASTIGPAGRTAAQVAGTAYLSDAEAEWYRSLPTSVKAAVEGGRTSSSGTSGGSGSTSAKSPAVPPEIQGLLDSFEGFSDKDVVNAYYAGEITRDQLAALITVRNTSEKGVPKYTQASLDRYLNQVDEQKPEPKRTALDVLGERFGNISRDFNVKSPDFGAKGAFASSTAGTLPSNNLFTPTSGRQGLVPFSTPGGNVNLAGAVVDNQFYPNRGHTVEDAGMMNGRLNYSGSPASILAQSGVYLGESSFATQMQALGNLIALREFFMEQNPSLSASQANDLAVGTMQPANPKQDPSASALANWADAPPDFGIMAHGGGMTLKEPTMGVGMYSGKPQFIAAEAGKQERVEPEGNGLRFTPTDKALPAQANPMAQERAFGQRGSMMALMRLLGIPGFATGGYYDEDTLSELTRSTSYDLSPRNLGMLYEGGGSEPVYTAPSLPLDDPREQARKALAGQQANARQAELDQYRASLNDVSGIANIGRLQRQRDAYDSRYGMAGMQTPVEVQAPLTGPMSALPPGVRYALESPTERLRQLFQLNDQQRSIDMARLLASESSGGGSSQPTSPKPPPQNQTGEWVWTDLGWVWYP